MGNGSLATVITQQPFYFGPRISELLFFFGLDICPIKGPRPNFPVHCCKQLLGGTSPVASRRLSTVPLQLTPAAFRDPLGGPSRVTPTTSQVCLKEELTGYPGGGELS